MAYWTHVGKVVGGGGLAALLWALLEAATGLGGAVVVFAAFVAAVCTAVHGVFTGIEAAVAAGRRERPGRQGEGSHGTDDATTSEP